MAYEFHADLRTPINSTVLWRYMDFVKFVDMVENKRLWFSRLDQLEDPLEGSHTDAELSGIRKNIGEKRAKQLIDVFRSARREVYVNCWRSGVSESLAMWGLYAKGSAVVAVKSTVGRLKQSVSKYQHPVFISKLRYFDWNEAPGLDNVLVASSRKDSSYQHEAEVRAIIMKYATSSTEKQSTGITVPVDLNHLITEIIVGPREQDWIVQLVRRVAQTYEISGSVLASNRLKRRR